MAFTQKLLASRLRDARQAAGITQETAAEALGIPRTAIVQLEAAKRTVSTLELTQLARLYGQSVAVLLANAPQSDESDALVALFRAAAARGTGAPWQRDAERCLAVCRTGADLKRLLGASNAGWPPSYDCLVPSRTMEAVRQGTDAARQERSRLGLGSRPIPDMADLVNSLGIWATGADLPDGMSGVFLKDRDAGLVILVNFDHPRPRKRFSYAHEYAHALFDRQAPAVVSWEAECDAILETRANAFAAEFLLPEDGVRTFLAERSKGGPAVTEHVIPPMVSSSGEASRTVKRAPAGSQRVTFEDAARLAFRYGVAFKTAVFRLKNTAMIGEQEFQTLLAQESLAARYSKLLFQEDPPATGTRDRSLVPEVIHLAIEAYRRELISGGKLREVGRLLDVPSRDLVELAEGASG